MIHYYKSRRYDFARNTLKFHDFPHNSSYHRFRPAGEEVIENRDWHEEEEEDEENITDADDIKRAMH